ARIYRRGRRMGSVACARALDHFYRALGHPLARDPSPFAFRYRMDDRYRADLGTHRASYWRVAHLGLVCPVAFSRGTKAGPARNEDPAGDHEISSSDGDRAHESLALLGR